MNETRFDLVGIGSMVVDLIYRTPRIIGAEEKILLNRYDSGEPVKRLVGGVVVNHLAWASLMGLRVGVFGKQGDDEEGRFLRAGMERYGIDKRITLDGSASSFALIFVDPDGGRAIYMNPAATSETTGDYVRDAHADYIRGSRVLSTEVSQLPLDAVIAALEIARSAGASTVLDVDVPRSDAVKTLGSEEEFERALGLASILKPTLGAASEITGEKDALEAARLLRSRYGSRAVVITDGEAGCAISCDEYSGRVPGYRLKAVDSTGAGDAFLGGMIAGLNYELGWEDALRLANACGAACCEISGATPDLTASRDRVFELYDGRPFAARERGGADALSAPASPYEKAVGIFLEVALEELDKMRSRITPDYFARAADLIARVEAAGGRLHVTGVGKPEYVSGYISALLSSTGTPAYFLHGTECVHGSAGQVAPGDAVIVISNSGETLEMKSTVLALKHNGAVIIGVSGKPGSWLARESDEFLFAGVEREGSPLNFEPRASILAEIYVLAALSIELQSRKGITRSHYNAWHPGGMIGLATRE
ncbi:MAG: SIS domain-containing protein [Blastocatellales bacterium]|nr:SIS domain-containing protein [Blastocatellales bacterium]